MTDEIQLAYHRASAASALQRAALFHLLMLGGRTLLAAWALWMVASQPGSEDYLYVFLGGGFVISASGTAISAVLLLVGARHLPDGRTGVAWAGVVLGTLWPLVLAMLVLLMFAPWFLPMQLLCAAATIWAGTRLRQARPETTA